MEESVCIERIGVRLWYLDQQHLGNIVRVEQVDVDAVRDKFKALKSGKAKVSARDCSVGMDIWIVVYRQQKQERLEKERLEKEKV